MRWYDAEPWYDVMNSLSHLRQSIRTHRQQLPHDAVINASSQITKKILTLPEFQKSKNIAFYITDENEIDPSSILQETLKLNKIPYLPVFSEENKHRLSFYRIDQHTQYAKNKWGIDEPIIQHESAIQPEKLDLIFLPLVLFDAQCHRVGRGAGCYDRCLQFALNTPKNKRPLLVGLAYEFQKVKKIIPQSWDVPMDCIVTQAQIYHASSSEF